MVIHKKKLALPELPGSGWFFPAMARSAPPRCALFACKNHPAPGNSGRAKKLRIYCLALLILIPYPAQAIDGIYLWAEGGWAKLSDIPSAAQVDATTMDQSQTPDSYRASVGYNHDFNPIFGLGLEVARASYGKNTYHFEHEEDMQISLSTVEFLGVINLHIQDFDIFTKLGGLRATPSITGTQALKERTIINPEFGLGTAYNLHNKRYPFLRHLAVSLSYIKVIRNWNNDTDLKSNRGEMPSFSVASDGILLGLRYTFGP